MNRDCDNKNRLVPSWFQVIWCVGLDDKQHRSEKFKTYREATDFYKEVVEKLKNVVCSNVVIYVGNKQGYMNYVRSWFLYETGAEEEVRCTEEDLR